EPRWFRIGVRIKHWCGHGGIARPKTKTTDLLRICFARNLVRKMWHAAGMGRRGPAGKPGDRQIETAPEKMHRAAFTAKARAKFLKHAIRLGEHPPEPIGILGIIRSMLL